MSAPVIDAYLEELLHDPVLHHATHELSAVETPVVHAPVIEARALEQPVIDTPRPAPPVNSEAMPATLASPSAAAVNPPAPHRHFVPDESTPRSVASGSRWLRVGIGTDSYGLELLCVQEVVRMAPILAMRGAGVSVLGVMNLRGRIVPVLDLGLWLGLSCVQPDERSRIVVVERNDELIGVLVTKVDDVVTLNQADVEPPLPGTIPGAFLGIARVGQTPTVLLQAEALFA